MVLFIYIRNRIHRLNSDASIYPGVSFYTTLIAIPFLFIASITACCGHRKDKRGTASSGNGFYSTGKYANADTDFGTADTATKTNSFPMKNSRQRVLDAFHGKDKSTATTGTAA